MLLRRAATLSPATILAIGWCAFVVYAYPGLMADDSFAALADARAGVFHDPPLLAAIWSMFDLVVVGPFPMLALQSLAFLAGAYLLGRAVVTPRAAAACAAGVLVFPPVAAGMAIVSSHALVAGLALLGAGLLGSTSARVRRLAIAMLVLATAARPNAIAATLPLAVFLLLPHLRWELWRRYAIALAVAVGMLVAAVALNRMLAAPARVAAQTASFGDTIGLGDDAQPIVTRGTQSIDQLRAFEIQSAHGWVQRTTGRAVDSLSRSIVFWPWVYLTLAIALLVRMRRTNELRALLASGIALELSLAWQGSTDWRESLWLVASTLLALALALARRRAPAT